MGSKAAAGTKAGEGAADGGASITRDLVHQLAALIGEGATFKLIEEFAGTRVYVPEKAERGAVLTKAIGIEAARLLSGTYGGIALNVPLARRWRMRFYRQTDMTRAQMARRLGCAERTVINYLAAP